jgi:hypothetical protein
MSYEGHISCPRSPTIFLKDRSSGINFELEQALSEKMDKYFVVYSMAFTFIDSELHCLHVRIVKQPITCQAYLLIIYLLATKGMY